MTFRCPRGHESTDPDYCSVCGIAMPATAVTAGGAGMAGSTVTPTAIPNGGAASLVGSTGANATVCPVCGTPRTDPTLRFCEVCRYDFQTGTPSPTSGGPAVAVATTPPPANAAPISAPPGLNDPNDPNDPFAAEFAALEAAAAAQGTDNGAATAPPSTPVPADPPAAIAPSPVTATPMVAPPITTNTGGGTPPATAPAVGPLWEVRVSVDPSLDTDPDPDLPAPTDEPDYFFPLTESETLIGRRDDRQGIHPQIPLRDPGASRRHAMLRTDADGVSVMDLGSTNGTSVNGVELPANSRRMLKNGDAITVGRWTRLVVRSDTT